MLGGKATSGGSMTRANVMVLRRLYESAELEAAETKKDALRPLTECGGGRLGARHDMPVIAGPHLPRRTHDRRQRNANLPASGDGIGRNPVGIRVGGVDDSVGRVVAQPSTKTLCATEAAGARRESVGASAPTCVRRAKGSPRSANRQRAAGPVRRLPWSRQG